MYHRQPMPVLSSRATDVVCPIMVLNANDTMVAMDTPLERVLVSKISAGMIHDSGPHVALNEKLYSHVMAMNPQAAPPLPSAEPGGNLASSTVAMMKVTMLPRLPRIRGQRRPVWSMSIMHRNCATRAITDEMAW